MIPKLHLSRQWRTGTLLAAALFASTLAAAAEPSRPLLVLTSTNDANSNSVAVFALTGSDLTLTQTLPTGGIGGASGNGGILQFKDGAGAVANFGSNTVTRLRRADDSISVDGTINLSPDCVHPDSVALAHDHLFIVGENCAESHAWPEGYSETGSGVIKLSDPTAGQIAVGKTWAAVTLKSGSLLQLPLSRWGGLSGRSTSITLPGDASTVPLGAAFWDDTLGFDPAHSVDSFALVTSQGQVYPVAGPTPVFPSNAPCWVAKGTWKHLVHGQLAGPGDLHILQRWPGRGVLQVGSGAGGGHRLEHIARWPLAGCDLYG